MQPWMQLLKTHSLVVEVDDDTCVEHAEYVHDKREQQVFGDERHDYARRRDYFSDQQKEHNFCENEMNISQITE